MKKHKRLFAVLVFGVAATTCRAQDANHPHEWSYEGQDGPAQWGKLKGEYSTCSTGKEQSPIDIQNATKTKLPDIHFDYKSSPLRIINNGHTIQVNYAPGSFVSVGDKRYELKQFHFHRPSEEKIEGKPFDMVAHLVHADSDGKLAVVAVLLNGGKTNSTIAEIWAHMPKQEGKEQGIQGVQVNASALLPEKRAYYTFPGSLTTPPCSEGVTWFVLKTSAEISSGEIEAFATLYPHNARPIQPTNGRIVKVSD